MTPDQMQAVMQVVVSTSQQMDVGAQTAGGGAERPPSERGWNSMVNAVARRVDRFKGNYFLEWQFRFEAMLQSPNEGIAQLAQRAEARQDTVHPETDIDDSNNMINKQLYCRRRREKHSTWSIMSRGGGTEAWRKLCRRFAGKTRGRRFHLSRSRVSSPKIKNLTDITGRWEINVRRLASEDQKELSGGL